MILGDQHVNKIYFDEHWKMKRKVMQSVSQIWQLLYFSTNYAVPSNIILYIVLLSIYQTHDVKTGRQGSIPTNSCPLLLKEKLLKKSESRAMFIQSQKIVNIMNFLYTWKFHDVLVFNSDHFIVFWYRFFD